MFALALSGALIIATPTAGEPVPAAAASAIDTAQLKTMMRDMHRVGEAQAQVATRATLSASRFPDSTSSISSAVSRCRIPAGKAIVRCAGFRATEKLPVRGRR